MESLLITIIVFILVLNIILAWLFFRFLKNSNSKNKSEDSSFVMIHDQIKDIRHLVDSRLKESSEVIENQFNKSLGVIRQVTEELTRLGETNKQVMSFTEQLKNFENILKNPKQRGILGEYLLETVLANVLPPNSFKIQYQFNDGEIVDAAVFVQDKIIPIDSKFSLENYNKLVEETDLTRRLEIEKQFKADLKKRIDETSKYIRPRENTTDFAFMFIPAEGIYYDLLINQVGAIKSNTRDLIEYAYRDKHVIIVSPTTFHAYLQTILQGLRALKIEESAKEIRHRVEDLSRHLKSYEDFFVKIGSNLKTTVNSYNYAGKELGKIDKDILRITGKSGDLQGVELIDRPKTDDN